VASSFSGRLPEAAPRSAPRSVSFSHSAQLGRTGARAESVDVVPDPRPFLQTDPVPGGSANAYDYCNADPINCYDLAGTWPHWAKYLAKHWRGIAQGALFAGCMVMSAGACALAGLGLALAVNYRGGLNEAWGSFAIDAVGAAGGGLIGRAATGSWTESALERAAHEAGAAKHLARAAIGLHNTVINMAQNAFIGAYTTGVVVASHQYQL
jgi:hypothetical protein